jgi:Zn-dependent protease
MAAAMAALFTLVLLHEFGHCVACRGTGGAANEILMWPLGGLAYCLPPNRWQAHLVTAGGGPAVNVVLGLAFALVLGPATGRWWGVAVPNPFDFGGLYEVGPSWPLMALYIAAHLNLVLLLFNLLPIFPLDGGRIAQALLWPKLGYARSMRYAVRVGYGGAVGLLIAGLALQMWMLAGIAIFGGITCWITHKQLQFTEDVLGFGPPDAPESPPSRRRQRRAERRARQEAEEQRRVDAILHKIHESGLQSLTRPEKRLLHRTTQQKRRSPPNR